MTELQNIALVYESTVLVVEDAQARKKYLWDKYFHIWPIAATDMHLEDRTNREQYEMSLGFWANRLVVMIDAIVNRLDPTHGKYSEWVVQLMMKAAKAKNSKLFQELYKYARGTEDTYKVTEALTYYERYKHKLPLDQRDINKLTLDEVFALTEPFASADRELSQKELARKIKGEETIKLVNDLDGWTVVVPLTKDSARFYGAHTKWCTAAREDDHNMFEEYLSSGYIFVFIKGDEKYQWWADTNEYLSGKLKYDEWHKFFNKNDLETYDENQAEIEDQNYLTEHVQFMDAEDKEAKTVKVIPPAVWKATFEAPFIKGEQQKFVESQECMQDWWYETN